MPRQGTKDRQKVVRFARAAIAAAICVAALAPAPAQAQPLLDASVAYLQSAQNTDGGFGGSIGKPSDPLFTGWAALGLAAAGVNPLDQRAGGGEHALAYLSAHVDELSVMTDYERTLLVVAAAGADGHDFGRRDLVATIADRQLPDGSFPYSMTGQKGAINSTAFAVLALRAIGEPALDGDVQRAAGWLVTAQNADGGYGFATGVASEIDTTAAVVMALRTGGQAGSAAEQRAHSYLAQSQNDDGGLPLGRGLESNASSTSWTLEALWAVGDDPAAWSKAGGTPLDFLASMQQADGSVRQSASSDANRIWVTAYALPAMAGRSLPIAAVPRADPATQPANSVAEGEPVAGATNGKKSSAGVTSGGGGGGAKLFTRPRAAGRSRRSTRPRNELTATDATASPAKRSSTKGKQAGSGGSPSVGEAGIPVSGLPLSAQSFDDTRQAASGFKTAIDGGQSELTLAIVAALGALIAAGTLLEVRPAR